MEENPFINIAQQEEKKNVFIDVLQSVVIAITLSIVLYLFIITPNEVDGPSMEPNFVTGDLLFTSKIHKWFNGTGVGKALGLNYKRGDVVVFQKPGLSDFVKRIIAVPGDTIAIEDGTFYINGQALEEEYDLKNALRRDGTFLKDGDLPIKLDSDEYFLSGDHRDVSHDSRSLGLIKRDWIKGKVVFRFWPPQKIGFIGSGKSELVDPYDIPEFRNEIGVTSYGF